MTRTIYVALKDEGTDVWRPVSATQVDGYVWRIDEQLVPGDEVWEFDPGATVIVSERLVESDSCLVAVQLKK